MRLAVFTGRAPFTWAVLVGLIVGATGVAIMSATGGAANPSGRVLTQNEMAWLVGDAPNQLCKKQYNCQSNFPITDPMFVCYYCSTTGLTINVCCSGAQTDSCYLNGGIACDANPALIQWEGTQAGAAYTCGIYQSCGNAVQGSTCGRAIQQTSATGNSCNTGQ